MSTTTSEYQGQCQEEHVECLLTSILGATTSRKLITLPIDILDRIVSFVPLILSQRDVGPLLLVCTLLHDVAIPHYVRTVCLNKTRLRPFCTLMLSHADTYIVHLRQLTIQHVLYNTTTESSILPDDNLEDLSLLAGLLERATGLRSISITEAENIFLLEPRIYKAVRHSGAQLETMTLKSSVISQGIVTALSQLQAATVYLEGTFSPIHRLPGFHPRLHKLILRHIGEAVPIDLVPPRSRSAAVQSVDLSGFNLSQCKN